MADIDNISNKIQTDARIASILQKLREADEKDKSSNKNNDKETASDTVGSKEDTKKSVQEPRVQELANSDKIVNQMKDLVDNKIHDDMISNNFVDELILPWFTQEDRDTEYLHYMHLENNGSTAYTRTKLNKSINDIASLKLKKDYLCDIDYQDKCQFRKQILSFSKADISKAIKLLQQIDNYKICLVGPKSAIEQCGNIERVYTL